MIIGNVISNRGNIPNLYSFIGQFKEYSNINTNLPTLVIGKKFAESIFGKEKIHIIDRKIENNITWCFAKSENRNDYEASIKEFKSKLINSIKERLKYRSYSLFTNSFESIKNFVKFLYNDSFKVFYITRKHTFIQYSNNVIGISNKELEYIGINLNKAILKIMKNKNNCVFYDRIDAIGRDTIEITDEIIIPYLYLLKNY